MGKERGYQVKEVAQLAGVSVRTLHHYDEIGLLAPSRRSPAGYRLYREDDLLRLQQILIGRELGLPLEVIKRDLDDPAFDRRAALQQQRQALTDRVERTTAMLHAIDVALALLPGEGANTMRDMSTQEARALFDGFDPTRHEAEAKQRWGESSAYKESARRTAQYTKADWERYKRESDAVMTAAAALLGAGVHPSTPEAMALADRHRQLIDRWFYPCDATMHEKLADLYESDTRFAENIDTHGHGLTHWLAEAIRANGAG